MVPARAWIHSIYERKFFFHCYGTSNLSSDSLYLFSRQSCKTGYGGVKVTSINQTELERQAGRKKSSDFFFS